MQSHIWLTSNNLLIYGENICAFPRILGSLSPYMTLHPIPSEFPWGKFCFPFYQCGLVNVDVQGLCQVLHVQPGTDWGEGGEPTRHHQASQIQHMQMFTLICSLLTSRKDKYKETSMAHPPCHSHHTLSKYRFLEEFLPLWKLVRKVIGYNRRQTYRYMYWQDYGYRTPAFIYK